MPLPTPQQKESKQDFLSRCLADETMLKEYPQGVQRYAVCLTQFKTAKQQESKTKTGKKQE